MKKLIILFLMVLLNSCSNEISEEYVLDDKTYQCYAINMVDDSIDVVEVYYKINDYIDVFNLYTNYQNYLPIGYYVNSSSNLELIDCYLDGMDVYYVVDSYISLIDNLDLFSTILEETNKLLGYEETFIIVK
jgi:hypothetical protein